MLLKDASLRRDESSSQYHFIQAIKVGQIFPTESNTQTIRSISVLISEVSRLVRCPDYPGE